MQAILIGFGQIGRALFEDLKWSHCIKIISKRRRTLLRVGEWNGDGKVDVLLVAIPYSNNFIKEVKAYQKEFKPKATIIFSTVPVGTCRELKAVHSPIEGKHPDLADSIAIHKRWFGGVNKTAERFLTEAEFILKKVPKPEFTEFLKLRSTSLYGLNIEFARYSAEVAKKLGMNYNLVKEFDEDYNKLYNELGFGDKFKRYILDAPSGNIGGHCVVPNAEILDKQFPSVFLKEIYKQKTKTPK